MLKTEKCAETVKNAVEALLQTKLELKREETENCFSIEMPDVTLKSGDSAEFLIGIAGNTLTLMAHLTRLCHFRAEEVAEVACRINGEYNGIRFYISQKYIAAGSFAFIHPEYEGEAARLTRIITDFLMLLTAFGGELIEANRMSDEEKQKRRDELFHRHMPSSTAESEESAGPEASESSASFDFSLFDE